MNELEMNRKLLNDMLNNSTGLLSAEIIKQSEKVDELILKEMRKSLDAECEKK